MAAAMAAADGFRPVAPRHSACAPVESILNPSALPCDLARALPDVEQSRWCYNMGLALPNRNVPRPRSRRGSGGAITWTSTVIPAD